MTGHDRTQPDTKPDISDICARDTVQNTPDTTGHYRTLPDTKPDMLPDMLPDITGHVSGHDRTGSDSITCADVQNVQFETGHPGHILDIPDISDTSP